jgi:hypothetical protein
MILLAKALELIGAYYVAAVDRSRKTRNANLQREIKNWDIDTYMTRTAEWLFGLANTRKELRHIWDRAGPPPGVTMHPASTVAEQQEFVSNADLLIRAFVCHRLGLPFVRYVTDSPL